MGIIPQGVVEKIGERRGNNLNFSPFLSSESSIVSTPKRRTGFLRALRITVANWITILSGDFVSKGTNWEQHWEQTGNRTPQNRGEQGLTSTT